MSGAVADLLQAQPNPTPDQVKARRMETAYKSFPTSSVATDGCGYRPKLRGLLRCAEPRRGYLDLVQALGRQDVSQGSTLSPTVNVNWRSHKLDLQFDPSSTWACSGYWGINSPANVWGSTALGVSATILSGAPILNNISGSSAVWGNSAVWGTSAVSGNSDRR